MRLFVAVLLEDGLVKEITGTMHELKKAGVKGNYTPARNLHMTLAFLGEVKDVASVKEVIKQVEVKPFKLSFSELGNFGDLLMINMKGNQGLSATVKSLRSALDRAGIDYDKKKFVPHITIVRKAAGKWKQVPAPKGSMMVKEIVLMKSEEKNGKRVYTRI